MATVSGSGSLEISLSPYAKDIEAPDSRIVEEGTRLIYEDLKDGQEVQIGYSFDVPSEQEGIGFHLGPEEGYVLWESQWFPRESGSEYGEPVPYSLFVDLPEEFSAVGAGEIGVGRGRTEIRYDEPSRPFFVYGHYKVARAGGAEFWYRSGLSDEAERLAVRIATLAGDLKELYNGIFGPVSSQPFRMVDITRRGGWGAPMTLLLSENSLLNIASEEQISVRWYWYIAHELSHTWWGNHVVPSDDIYGFMVEGAANYSAALAVERQFGVQTARDLWAEWASDALSDVALFGLEPDNPHYPQVAYNKGAWIHRMLEGWLGRESYLLTLKGIVSEESRPTLDSFMLRLAASGRLMPPQLRSRYPDLRGEELLRRFFQEWGSELKYPFYEMQRKNAHWCLKNSGNAATPPFRVLADNEEEWIILEPGQIYEFEPSIIEVEIDPDGYVIQVPSSQIESAWRTPTEEEIRALTPVVDALRSALDSGEPDRVKSFFQEANEAVEALASNSGKLHLQNWRIARIREADPGLDLEIHVSGHLGETAVSGLIIIQVHDNRAIAIKRIRISNS